MFPIILETSDSKWDTTSAVKKSLSSLKRYYIPEMTSDEGLTEVVNRLKLFVKKDYDIVYKTIGRHIGSYHVLLRDMQTNVSLEEALEEMRISTYAHLISSIIQSGNITDVILQSRAQDYSKLHVFVVRGDEICRSQLYHVFCSQRSCDRSQLHYGSIINTQVFHSLEIL